jgi:DNA-binding response OmpR family regulator
MDKILVADDSHTIQKVVKITMANTDYEVVEALDINELHSKLENDNFSLLLLDFNLDENQTGYDLSRSIRSKNADLPILVMLGTFDQVEEGELSDAGVSDKVVKPFESQKFISKCVELIEGSRAHGELNEEDSEIEEIEDIEEVEIVEETDETEIADSNDDLASGWELDAPMANSELVDNASKTEGDTFSENTFEEGKNLLLDEVKGWGVEVPGVIGEDKSNVTLPPQMSEQNLTQEKEVEEVEEEEVVFKLPQGEDLEYPDIASNTSEISFNPVEDVATVEPKSKLISLEELQEEEEEEVNEGPNEIEFSNNTELEKEVDSELSTEDFWSVDENGTKTTDDEQEQSGIAEIDILEGQDEGAAKGTSNMGSNYSPFALHDVDDSPAVSFELDPNDPVEVLLDGPLQESGETSSTVNLGDIQKDEIVKQVLEALRPQIKSIIKDLYQEQIEKVAWEVIPDLAENIIRSEIKEISSSLTPQQ